MLIRLVCLCAFSPHFWVTGKDTGTCGTHDEMSSRCNGEDNATTVRELGLDILAQVLGHRPTDWQETQIAPILASIGEGNYGEITRLHVKFDMVVRGDDTPLTPLDIVVKRFSPKPAERVGGGLRNLTEHARFLQGFPIEARAYKSIVPVLNAAGLAAPRLLYVTELEHGKPFTMLLEDLSRRFPRGSNGEVRQMSPKEVSAGLRWLAGFHSLFWEDTRIEERGLWPRGSYWVLDDLAQLELKELPGDYQNRYITADELVRLKRAAVAVDKRLAGRPANLHSQEGSTPPKPRHRTLVHGDAKPENILCSTTEEVQCAGIDFGWVGSGYGMYDVIYLLWDQMASNEVERYLDEYHAILMQRLPPETGRDYSPEVMRRHFELCVVDFTRWMIGFRGGEYFWAMPWAVDTLRKVLDRLDGGGKMEEEAYATAVDHEFPFP